MHLFGCISLSLLQEAGSPPGHAYPSHGDFERLTGNKSSQIGESFCRFTVNSI